MNAAQQGKWAVETVDFATVDDWWRLGARDRSYRAISNTLLKDWGYMRIFEFIRSRTPERVLEFGHGFSDRLFAGDYQYQPELWGVDKDQGLPYFPTGLEYRELLDSQLLSKFPEVNFRSGLLGDGSVDLPEDYFDLICSVSVMEEILDFDLVHQINEDAFRRLRKGGYYIHSFDLRVNCPYRLALFLRSLRGKSPAKKYAISSLISFALYKTQAFFRADGLLIENPSVVRTTYEMGEQSPSYGGHWTSAFIVAKKS